MIGKTDASRPRCVLFISFIALTTVYIIYLHAHTYVISVTAALAVPGGPLLGFLTTPGAGPVHGTQEVLS